MSVLNNKIIINGLVFNFDINNVKSYMGEPTTNILPSPSYNALPTYGNGWGTYNVNQYNNGSYFSIGSISSVTNNIVTTSGNHGLRTYDVMQPQTTGGGVTAATNYFIKKLSNTTFTLHPYNSSQDGSLGYINPSTGTHKVWDDIYNDNRVSINSTSFPTMWWGYPHLPNSGLVKEIIPNGFNAIPGVNTDCIRLNYSRPDGVTDGMSYNVDFTSTPGVPYTISFWTRSADVNAPGKLILYHNYNYTGGSAAGYYNYFNLGPLGVWQKRSFTITYAYNTVISYWFDQSNGPYRWDMANIQVEQKSHATAFSLGTRSVTQGLLDLTGNYTLDLTNAGFDSGGNLTFNRATPNSIDLNTQSLITGTNPFTIEAWYNVNTNTGCVIIGNYGTSYTSGNLWFAEAGLWINGSVYFDSYQSTMQGLHHIVATRDGSGNVKLYKDGNLAKTGTLTGSVPSNINWRIGADVNGGAEGFNGSIYTVKVYNRVLTASEILQNFNATKGRFGL